MSEDGAKRIPDYYRHGLYYCCYHSQSIEGSENVHPSPWSERGLDNLEPEDRNQSIDDPALDHNCHDIRNDRLERTDFDSRAASAEVHHTDFVVR